MPDSRVWETIQWGRDGPKLESTCPVSREHLKGARPWLPFTKEGPILPDHPTFLETLSTRLFM